MEYLIATLGVGLDHPVAVSIPPPVGAGRQILAHDRRFLDSNLFG